MSILSRFFIAKSHAAAKKAPAGIDAADITDIEVSTLDELVTGVADRNLDGVETDEGDDRSAKIEGCAAALGGRFGFHQIAANNRATSTMRSRKGVMSGSP
jgi:hypothetical protein